MRAWAAPGQAIYSDSDAIGNLPQKVPESLVTDSPFLSTQLNSSEKILRSTTNQYTSGGNNIVRFEFPSENMDLRRGYLLVDVSLAKTGGTFVRLQQGSWSLFGRIVIVIGSVQYDYQYWNRMYSMKWNSASNAPVEASIGTDLLGIGTQARRNTLGAQAFTTYAVPVDCGFLHQGVLPLAALCNTLNGQTMYIELFIDNPLQVVETDGTNPIITVSNARWHYENLWSTDKTYERKIAELIATGTFKFGWTETQIYQNAVINTVSDLPIQWKGSSLSAIITLLVDATSQTNPLVNNKMTTWLKTMANGATVTDFQHQVNMNWIPQEAVICIGFGDRAYEQYLKWKGLWKEDASRMVIGAGIDLPSFQVDQFIIVGNFCAAPTDVLYPEEYFNALSTRGQGYNTILRLTLSVPPPVQTVAYHIIYYSTLVTVDSNGLVKKYL